MCQFGLQCRVNAMLRAAVGLRSKAASCAVLATFTGAQSALQDRTGRRFFDGASDRDGNPTALKAPFPILGFLRCVLCLKACRLDLEARRTDQCPLVDGSEVGGPTCKRARVLVQIRARKASLCC